MKLLPLLILVIVSCQQVNLKKKQVTNKQEPFQITIVGPNDSVSFDFRLYDSLHYHISKLNGNGLSLLDAPTQNKDSYIGWLQNQMDDDFEGIGSKAASEIESDRTSDEFSFKSNKTNSIDKASFTVKYLIDSIPKKFLYREIWKTEIAKQKDWQNKIKKEKNQFINGGTLIRTKNNMKDTLYGYQYNLKIAIRINYFENSKNSVKHIEFDLPAQTIVYHQLKF